MEFSCLKSNSIDNFSPNPFSFNFVRNPDRSEIHLFSIFQDFPISPVKAVKILLKPKAPQDLQDGVLRLQNGSPNHEQLHFKDMGLM